MKKFLILLVIAGLVGGGFYYYRGKSNSGEAATAADAQKSVKVEKDDIQLQVSTTGKVAANLEVDIKSKASGTIIYLPFDISDRVSSGTKLIELDPVDENRNVSLRQASLIAARARYSQAQEELRISETQNVSETSSSLVALESARVKHIEAKSRMTRNEELFRKNLVSPEVMENSRGILATASNELQQAESRVEEIKNLPRTLEIRRQSIKLAESEVRQAQVELDNATQRLKETQIFAPIDGVVTSRPVQIGQIIASGISNVGGGTTLMTLSDLSRIYVNANVDETDIGKVKTGQASVITVDAYPGRRFRGSVVRVSSKGQTNSNVVTFEVKIEVGAEGRELLKPEMTANVNIQADERVGVLTLPNEAVQFGKEGYFVELAKAENGSTQTIIKTGLTDGLKTEIVSGLKEGQEIVIPAQMRSRWSRDGQQAGGGASVQRGMRVMGMGGRPGGSGGGPRR